MLLSLLAIAAFLAIASFFEGAETSLLSISHVRLQTLVRRGEPRALVIEKLRNNVRTLLGTMLLGQTVCDIAAASLATLVAHDLMGESGVAVETVVMTVIVLIFVNLIPKSHAANNVERWALFAAKPIYFLTKALGPVIGMIDRFVALFVRSQGAEVLVTEEEIKTMTHLGVKTGALEHGEKELIDRVFLFNDITAGDVMTPREIVFGLEASTPIGAALAAVNAQKYSRYPVYDGSLDAVVGVVHIRDLLAQVQKPGALEMLTVREVSSPPVFVQEKALIDDLFRELKRQRVHLAVVVNDQKAVVGVVTLEDLIEELVGEISDESDVDEHVIKRIDKHAILVHGDTDIPDVNRFFNTKIESGEERTVGRLVRRKAGKTPKQGQPVMVDEGLMAIVEQINRGRILKVRLIKSVNGAAAGEKA